MSDVRSLRSSKGNDNRFYATGRRKDSVARVWLSYNNTPLVPNATAEEGKLDLDFIRKCCKQLKLRRPGAPNGMKRLRDVEIDTVFSMDQSVMVMMRPFITSGTLGKFTALITVRGGGISGQAGAISHAISRALCDADVTLRPMLKSSGLLTRDSRVVERKKYGRHKARKSTQFSKR